MAKRLINQKNIDKIFFVSLILKGLFSVIEIIGGIATFFISQEFLIDFIQNMTQGELLEDPNDIIANRLYRWALNFSLSAKYFAAVYLLSHGIVKLWLIIGLLKRVLWYYPTALAVFGLFITYQVYRYSRTHSLLLIFITILDLVVIVLTWEEYRFLRKMKDEVKKH